MIVDTGRRAIAEFLRQYFTQMDLGDGSDITNPAQVALDNPIIIDKQTITPVLHADTGYTLEFTADFTGSTLQGSTLSEIGIFGISSIALGSDNVDWDSNDEIKNKLLVREVIDTLGPFSSTDTITVSVVIEVI
tara:strand:+ start:134 stop:535 length:402 start_codon:yes stop_codon:yes gene_type:complete